MSTQATHTPGPWSADKWAPGWTVSAPESRYSVCHLEDCNNAEANARLIAAAPDLLQLLGDLGQWLETHLAQGNINAGTANRDGDFVSQIRSTITKATAKE